MLEEIQEKLLADIRYSETLLVVEGKRDREALRKAGLDNIVEISGRQLERVVDVVKSKQSQVTILTDYDEEGVKQYKRLKKLLLSDGVKVNDIFRRDFKRAFLVNRIEELNGYFK
jgi:5S rRNA maturation endonuclease (ribonuclease M5)